MPTQGFGDLVERVGPAVVNIQTSREAVMQEDIPLPQFPGLALRGVLQGLLRP
ncbi:MAG: hypothetical protein R3D25_04995 [Geminicoccaceae bacterium]